MSKKLSWKGSEASYKQKNFPERINNETLETNSSFHVKERTTRKSLIFIIEEFFSSNTKTFILARTLGNRPSFYEVETVSY